MNPVSFKEAKKLLVQTKKLAATHKNIHIVVLPPALYVRELRSGAPGRLAFGVQHAHPEPTGSHTGEISIAQCKDAKMTHVLIGHAERRAQGETNADVRAQLSATLALSLLPVLCIGEKVRGQGAEHFSEVREQLLAAIPDDIGKKLSKITIAYEPVWAIGGAVAMRPHDMHEMSIFIRKTLVEKFGALGHSVVVLYGGSIDATNAVDMLKNGDVAGLLVGRASIDNLVFSKLVQVIAGA